jgi:hypothetical protein
LGLEWELWNFNFGVGFGGMGNEWVIMKRFCLRVATRTPYHVLWFSYDVLRVVCFERRVCLAPLRLFHLGAAVFFSPTLSPPVGGMVALSQPGDQGAPRSPFFSALMGLQLREMGPQVKTYLTQAGDLSVARPSLPQVRLVLRIFFELAK